MATKNTTTKTAEKTFPYIVESSKSGEETYTYKMAVAEDLTIENTFTMGTALGIRMMMLSNKTTKDETRGAIMAFLFSVILGDENTLDVADRFDEEDTESALEVLGKLVTKVVTDVVGKETKN